MQEEKSIIQTFIKGLIIILVSILMSIVTYYVTNAWIFDINIFDYKQNYENFIITINNLGSPYLKLKAYYPLAYSLTPFLYCILANI